MARKLTVQDLTNQGVDQTKAEAIVANVNQPKPRSIAWVFKATQKEAEEVARAFPKISFAKRYKKREEKVAEKKSLPAKKS